MKLIDSCPVYLVTSRVRSGTCRYTRVGRRRRGRLHVTSHPGGRSGPLRKASSPFLWRVEDLQFCASLDACRADLYPKDRVGLPTGWVSLGPKGSPACGVTPRQDFSPDGPSLTDTETSGPLGVRDSGVCGVAGRTPIRSLVFPFQRRLFPNQ